MIPTIIFFALIVVAGISRAVVNTLRFRYEDSYFSKLNPKFWNPHESWRNQYKNGDVDCGPRFFLSTSYLCCLTGAWYLFQFTMYTSMQIAMVIVYLEIGHEWYRGIELLISIKIIMELSHKLFYKDIFIINENKDQ